MTRAQYALLVATRMMAFGLLWSTAAGWASAACEGPLNVGFRVVQIPGGPKMALWYPTTEAERAHTYAANSIGSVAMNGRPATCSRFPLVVFSHGFGGCGVQSVFFTETLARRGYVIAAPDHGDALCSVDGSGMLQLKLPEQSFFEPAKWTDTTHDDRRADIQAVIDWSLRAPEFNQVVDPAKIAAAAHSLGGYTVAGMVGGWDRWRDPRIQAAVLLSPYVLPYLLQDRIRHIQVPVMFQGAQLDIGITPFLTGENGAYARTSLPKFLVELRAGSHFEWTNALCADQPSLSDCLKTKTNAQLIVDYAAAFLNRYLNRDVDVITKLTGAGLATYKRTVPLASVQAASYSAGAAVAPDSIVSAFGDALAANTLSAERLPLPTSLGGVAVTIKDSSGTTHRAPLFLVSPLQVNYVMPPAASAGTAEVRVVIGNEPVAMGTIQVEHVAPSLFAADNTGAGVAAAHFLRVEGNGQRTLDLVFNPETRRAVPIDLGDDSSSVYLMLYGTGLRRSTAGLQATVGGQSVPVTAFAAHSIYAGLDQVNIGPLPRSLRGRGSADILLTVDGKRTNVLSVTIR